MLELDRSTLSVIDGCGFCFNLDSAKYPVHVSLAVESDIGQFLNEEDYFHIFKLTYSFLHEVNSYLLKEDF